MAKKKLKAKKKPKTIDPDEWKMVRLDLLAGNITQKEAAKQLKSTPGAVHQRLAHERRKNPKIQRAQPKKQKVSNEQWDAALNDIEAGKLTAVETAKKLGVTPNAVYLRQRNKKARRVARSGERRAKGRDWDGIFRDVKAGQPVLDVAAKYNVPASTIHTRLRRLEAEEAPTVREYAVNDEESIEKISATIIKINGTPGEVRDFLKEM